MQNIVQVTVKNENETVDPIIKKLDKINKFQPLIQPLPFWPNIWRRETYPSIQPNNESSLLNSSEQLLQESLYTFADKFRNKSNNQVKVLIDNQNKLRDEIIIMENVAPRYFNQTLNLIQKQEFEQEQLSQTLNHLYKDISQLQVTLNNVFLHLNILHENLEFTNSDFSLDSRKYPNLSILLAHHKSFNSSTHSQTPTPILSPTNPLVRTSIDVQHSFSTTQLQLHQPKSYSSPKLPSPALPTQKAHKINKFFNLKSSMSLMNMKGSKGQQPPKKMSNAHEHLAKIATATATNSNKKFNTLNTKHVTPPATGPFLSRLLPNFFSPSSAHEPPAYYSPQSKTVGKQTFGHRKELVDWEDWRSMTLDSV